MNQKKPLIIFFCLVSIYGFGKETLKLPQKEINISIPDNKQLGEVAPEELFFESSTNTLHTASKNEVQEEIAYPLKESNFEEVFGSNP